MRDDLILEDTTLRDGEQAPGIAFSKETKLKIFDALVDAGVRWIEAGIPAMGGEELETLKAMVARGHDVRLIAWNRGVREDVELSLQSGFTAVHIGLPTSEVHLSGSLGRDRAWLLSRARDLIHLAKDRGAFVSISAEDVGRTEMGFLEEYAGHVAAAGADRLRLSDTIGILTPAAYSDRVRALRRCVDIDLQCHTHNDFGLAVANTLAGLEAGARYFHVTVNAIGERAGMPDLAQSVMALRQLFNIDVGVRTERLTDLSRVVASAVRHPIAPWQPIVGDNVFAHESGIHVNGMLKDASTFEPFSPNLVGGQRRYVAGKHSGRRVIQEMLRQSGIDVDIELLGDLLDAVRAAAIRRQGGLSATQVAEIFTSLGIRQAVQSAEPSVSDGAGGGPSQ